MTDINEPQFTANVKSWIDTICSQLISVDQEFPFIGAEVEVRDKGKLQRRDLILRPRNNPKGFALTGEIKLPDKPDGKNPYNESLVLDAHEKASAVGSEYFFTWNINRFVLWQTFKPNTAIFDRQLNFYDWANLTNSEQLTSPEVIENLKRRWEEFLIEYAAIYRGAKPFTRRPLDQWFIHLLESALDRPTVYTLAAIQKQYTSKKTFHENLDQWLIMSLGATISEEEEEDNLQRAARYSCYVLANRIVFFDALRRKYPQRLKPLAIPKSVTSGDKLRERLEYAYRRAVETTDDYETVFRGEPFGDSLPFLSDNAVDAWRELIELVDAYDFTRLDYDIIGQIFDGLISPKERHRFGQHYTKSEIVDLINAFTIRKPDSIVLDPACGGGTFLIRSYARIKYLAAQSGDKPRHIDLLSRIYGVDLSSYAVHLSTIGLATRDLVRTSNYPRVACRDFFEVSDRTSIFPAGMSHEMDQLSFVGLPRLDAIIGNPPYIRQEKLSGSQKNKYRKLAQAPWHDLLLSGRSDIHIYFWPYACSFLKENGYLGFLTSSSWLDVNYGFPLQRWILENFAIVAIIESIDEPWFTDARVATTVTILRREPDMTKRLDHLVRFVQIRKPLSAILIDYQRGDDISARLEAAERIRDFIESTRKDLENDLWRIRVVKQCDLISAAEISDSESDETKETVNTAGLTESADPASTHTGAKLGINLRAPDIFFELMRICTSKFVPLGEIAKVRFGIKTGCDDFFYPRDITDERLRELSPKDFKEAYGISPGQTSKVRVCKAGEGSIHLIEAKYLEPEVHTLMEIDSLRIDQNKLKHRALVVNDSLSSIQHTHVAKYIRWGEKQEFHLLKTCEGREGKNRNWYQIEPDSRSFAILPKIQQYRHIVPLNDAGLLVNCSLLELCGSQCNPLLITAVLNSTIVGLFKWNYGRGLGREANLQLDVYSAKMMLVPDPRGIDPNLERKIEAAFRNMMQTSRTNLADELDYPERKNLDDLVLQMIGVKSKSIRSRLLSEIYTATRKHHQILRELELKTQRNRLRAARRGRSTPQSVGGEIWDMLIETGETFRPFPQDFLPPIDSARVEIVEIHNGHVRLLEMFGNYAVEVGAKRYEVGDIERARLLLAISAEGFDGPVGLPVSPAACSSILQDWKSYEQALNARFEELAGQRTADPSEYERIIADLRRRYRRWSAE